jgi:hypothetical protein
VTPTPFQAAWRAVTVALDVAKLELSDEAYRVLLDAVACRLAHDMVERALPATSERREAA